MKVRCDKNELAERLQSVGGIIQSTPTTKPILQDFLLRTDGDELLVEATDLDISARLRLERIEVEEEGQVALDASRLVSLVREIPSSAIVLESLEDGRGAHLRADGYELRLLGHDPAEFPDLAEFAAEGALEVSREKFAEMLRRVGVASSRDTSRYQLTGVFFEITGDRLVMTATDGKRLTNDRMRVENATERSVSGIVPNRAVDALCKVLATGDEIVQLSLLETEIQLSFGHGELLSKLIEGTFPDYQSVLPAEKTSKVTVRRSDLLAAVRSASLVTDRETATIAFRFEPEVIHLESHASDIGESRITVPANLEGDPLEIRFNPVYLIDALRTVNEDQIRMEFAGPARPGTIRGGMHYRHLLMPLVTG